MKLDCIKASDVGLEHGWVIINTINGGIVAWHPSEDSEFAWMKAADAMAEAIADMERTIYGLSPQKMRLQDAERRN